MRRGERPDQRPDSENALVEAGLPARDCSAQCLHELKLIVDLIYQGGPQLHALLGERYPPRTATPRAARARRDRRDSPRDEEDAQEIKNGDYARAWVAGTRPARPHFNATRQAERAHPIEVVGMPGLRAMMPFLHPVTIEQDKPAEAASAATGR